MDTLVEPWYSLHRHYRAVHDFSYSGSLILLQIVKWTEYDDGLARRASKMLNQAKLHRDLKVHAL